MAKFKVGDVVQIISNKDNFSGQGIGFVFVIREVHVDGGVWCRKKKGAGTGVIEDSLMLFGRVPEFCRIESEDFQMVTGGWDFAADIALKNGYLGETNGFQLYENKPNKQNKTIMNKITEFAKNLTLSADEKALRKVGLKTECGDYTADAQSIVLQALCKEREAKLIEIANAQIAEDNK